MNLFRSAFVLAGLALIVLLPNLVNAQTTAVSASEAAAVASNWFQLGQEMSWGWPASTSLSASAASVRPIVSDNEILAYCIALTSGGYMVIPAVRELPPITAYSTDSYLDPDKDEGFAALLKLTLGEKLELVRSVLSAANPPPEWLAVRAEIERCRADWSAYTSTYAEFTAAVQRANFEHGQRSSSRGLAYTIDDIQPLVQTSWHQGSPFYNDCPMGDGGRSVVGCVATAAAQIIAFWHYPDAGLSTRSYTWNGDQSCGGTTATETLSATFSDSYDWANILNRYTSSATQEQKDAVSELCYEVAVSVAMDFGHCGSGAFTGEVVNALPNFFGYSRDIDREDRVAYSTPDAWFNMLREELDLGRPMQYRISSHSIVCDGWRVSGGNQIHLNYGWDDSHTTWYTVDNLYCTWSGCSPSVEYVIRRIHPGGAVNASIEVTAPDGGEVWTVGEVHDILWNSVNVPGNIKVEINRSYPTGSWEVLALSAPNTGIYTWTVTNPTCTTARARITSISNPTISDMSDGDFSFLVPLIPPNVVICLDSSGRMKLNWNATGAPYYLVFSSATPDGPFDILEASTSGTQYLDPNDLMKNKYYAVVASSNP